MACGIVGANILQKTLEGPHWEGVWPCLDPWDGMRLRTSSSCWNVQGKHGPHSELFFFLIRKEPVALTKAVPFKPFVSADTLKVCALIGLHLLAAQKKGGSSGSQFPDLGQTRGDTVAQKSPDWDSDVESWTESEGTSSCEQCEHNVREPCSECCGARPVR